MAPRKIVEFLAGINRSSFSVGEFCYQYYLKLVLGELVLPARIHPSVEIRMPQKIKIARSVIIKKGTILHGRSSREFGIELGPETYIKEYCNLDSYGGYIHIKGYCAIGQFTILAGNGGIEIGKYVMFGGQNYVITDNHIYESLEVPYILQGSKTKKVVIEDNVWVGGRCVILPGVTIGRNSIIGAGSVIFEDIPPNTKYFNCRNIYKSEPIIHMQSKKY